MITIESKDQKEMIAALQQALADYRGGVGKELDDDAATNAINFCISRLGGKRNGVGGELAVHCEWDKGCEGEIAYIDDKGFIYCAYHGKRRQESGRRCRKLRPHEVKRLLSGKQVSSY